MTQHKACGISFNLLLVLVVISLLGPWQLEASGQVHNVGDDAKHQASQVALEAFSQDLKSLSANFEQSSTDGAGYLIEELNGVFYFQAPNQFRWAYREPVAELIVGDGERLWHFDPSLEQATVRTQPPASASPILALTNPDVMAESYLISAGAEPNTLRFTPKDAEAPIAEALVRLEDGQPSVVEWVDDFGQRTRIVFTDMTVNKKIDPALFRFEPPAGTDVLEGL